MLLFLVSRKPFVLTYLRPGSHDLRASKLKKFSHVFLVRVIIGKREVCNSFPDVFPEDFPRIPSERLVEYRIDLIPGTIS